MNWQLCSNSASAVADKTPGYLSIWSAVVINFEGL